MPKDKNPATEIVENIPVAIPVEPVVEPAVESPVVEPVVEQVVEPSVEPAVEPEVELPQLTKSDRIKKAAQAELDRMADEAKKRTPEVEEPTNEDEDE